MSDSETEVDDPSMNIEDSSDSEYECSIKKPKSVLDYNICKKVVNLSDQMSSYYSTLKKIRNWYKKAALEIIAGTSIVKA